MKRTIPIILLFLVSSMLPSCVLRKPVSSEYQLLDHDENAVLVLLLRDDVLLRLPQFSLGSDTIFGTGTIERDGKRTAFAGGIPVDDIEYAQLEEVSATGTLFVAIPAGVLAVAVLASMTGSQYVNVKEYTPSSGGSSCPYVYSWDGKRYVLEAETFGTSLGSALQRSTRHVLPSLRGENGIVRLKIADERPETHFLDRVKLTRVRHAPGTRVVLDPGGRPWQVGATEGPVRVHRAAAGRSRTNVVFRRPAGARRALLLVTARNRETAKGFFQEVFDYLGPDAPRFIRDIEQDDETVARLREWQRRAALNVTVLGGRNPLAGAIDAEATAVSFIRAVPLDLEGSTGDQFTVALDGLPGVWSVEDVSICWDAVTGLPEETLETASATGPSGEDIHELIMAEDGRYCTLLPPQAVELRYRAGDQDAAFAWTYCVEASGYLHLWYGQSGETELAARFALIPQPMRRAFVRGMLGRPDLVLAVFDELATPD